MMPTSRRSVSCSLLILCLLSNSIAQPGQVWAAERVAATFPNYSRMDLSPSAAIRAELGARLPTQLTARIQEYLQTDELLRGFSGRQDSEAYDDLAIAHETLAMEIVEQVGQLAKSDPSGSYIASLAYIDSLSAELPEAVYDLAKSLQLDWERSYLSILSEEFLQQKRSATGAGATAGIVAMAALGASLLYNKKNVPHYFSVLRRVFPIASRIGVARAALPFAGALTSWASIETLQKSGALSSKHPVSPAHLMSLGSQSEAPAVNEDELIEMILKTTAVSGATQVLMHVIRGAKWANRVTTPAKVHPGALLAGVAVFLVLDVGAEAGVDAYQYSKLKNQLLGARDRLDQGLSLGNPAQVYKAAEELRQSAVRLSHYLNRDILQAQRDFAEEVAALAEKHSPDSPAYERKMRELIGELAQATAEARADREFDNDLEYESYVVRELLKTSSDQALDQPDFARRHRLQIYQKGFERWLRRIEERAQYSHGAESRAELFRRYVASLNAAKDRELADQLRRGEIRRHSTHLLMQAAALIRSSGKKFIQWHADELLALAARNETLVQSTIEERP